MTEAKPFANCFRITGSEMVKRVSQYIGDLIPDAHVNSSVGFNSTAPTLT